MRFHLQNTLSSLFLFAFLGSASWSLADTTPIDFHATIVPILKDSCFACHVPGAAAPYAGTDPVTAKKIKKEVGDGVDALTMGDKFPFADEDPAAKQLKHLEKELDRKSVV